MGAFGGRCFTGFGSLISLGSFGRIGFITLGLGAEIEPVGPESTASACAAADCCGSLYACCMPGKT